MQPQCLIDQSISPLEAQFLGNFCIRSRRLGLKILLWAQLQLPEKEKKNEKLRKKKVSRQRTVMRMVKSENQGSTDARRG